MTDKNLEQKFADFNLKLKEFNENLVQVQKNVTEVHKDIAALSKNITSTSNKLQAFKGSSSKSLRQVEQNLTALIQNKTTDHHREQ